METIQQGYAKNTIVKLILNCRLCTNYDQAAWGYDIIWVSQLWKSRAKEAQQHATWGTLDTHDWILWVSHLHGSQCKLRIETTSSYLQANFERYCKENRPGRATCTHTHHAICINKGITPTWHEVCKGNGCRLRAINIHASLAMRSYNICWRILSVITFILTWGGRMSIAHIPCIRVHML
jgi:hypothetical protein